MRDPRDPWQPTWQQRMRRAGGGRLIYSDADVDHRADSFIGLKVGPQLVLVLQAATSLPTTIRSLLLMVILSSLGDAALS